MVVYRPLLGRLSKHPGFSTTIPPHAIFATYLVLEECIPDVLRHSGHGQNIALTFFVSLGADTIVQHDSVITNNPESGGRELVQ